MVPFQKHAQRVDWKNSSIIHCPQSGHEPWNSKIYSLAHLERVHCESMLVKSVPRCWGELILFASFVCSSEGLTSQETPFFPFPVHQHRGTDFTSILSQCTDLEDPSPESTIFSDP